MSRHQLIIGAALLAYGCSPPTKQAPAALLSNTEFLTDTKNASKSTSSILEKYLPSALARLGRDTAAIYYGSTVINDDSVSRQVIICLLAKGKIIGIEVKPKKDSLMFFQAINSKWKAAGKEKVNIGIIDTIKLDDFDGDSTKEIITATHPNMNGNRWMEIYHYSAATDIINYAGSFSTDYSISKERKQVTETYMGSWYADNSKTLYQWQNDKLIPKRRLVLAHDTPVTYGSKLTIEYYENPSNRLDGLQLKSKSKQHYTEDDKQLNARWEKFFTEN